MPEETPPKGRVGPASRGERRACRAAVPSRAAARFVAGRRGRPATLRPSKIMACSLLSGKGTTQPPTSGGYGLDNPAASELYDLPSRCSKGIRSFTRPDGLAAAGREGRLTKFALC